MACRLKLSQKLQWGQASLVYNGVKYLLQDIVLYRCVVPFQDGNLGNYHSNYQLSILVTGLGMDSCRIATTKDPSKYRNIANCTTSIHNFMPIPYYKQQNYCQQQNSSHPTPKVGKELCVPMCRNTVSCLLCVFVPNFVIGFWDIIMFATQTPFGILYTLVCNPGRPVRCAALCVLKK